MIKSYDDWEDFANSKVCHSWVATAIIGSAAVGAATTAYTSSRAVSAQQQSISEANRIQQQQYNTTRNDLAPYRELGQGNAQVLNERMPFLTSPITMDQATLEQTPGYQFNRTQGLKAVQNSAAARGLGVSGAALKGAATFATGLADSTYQNQFNNENTNRTNEYNRLKGLVDVGENAAAQTGVLGQKSADTQSTNTIGSGNAEAAGLNRIGTSVQSGLNNLSGYAMYRGLYGTPGSGGTNGSSGGYQPFAAEG